MLSKRGRLATLVYLAHLSLGWHTYTYRRELSFFFSLLDGNSDAPNLLELIRLVSLLYLECATFGAYRCFSLASLVVDLLKMKVPITAVYVSEVFQFPLQSSWVALAVPFGNHWVIYYFKCHQGLLSLTYEKCTMHSAWRYNSGWYSRFLAWFFFFVFFMMTWSVR